MNLPEDDCGEQFKEFCRYNGLDPLSKSLRNCWLNAIAAYRWKLEEPDILAQHTADIDGKEEE